ncbi:metal ABC transporter ATP-binding protein [Candidatus Neptunochlamydia vexilliferae]|uniref:Zinc transport system ATP-binding protein TroB n=1 Tax=Candidatus Neptunichlamydia vexilliferae TaxID=1651774 RepID=A0ABS0B0K8_9BACT|nr:metal ABC transporter ATP-binding protein [Candidatus Neptunochlamydia vexilliferae]MBF5059928.1 Zinc transport system ATP-binding protein TroB [Candidatus Neptunochlamydia vexilliferae]
MSVITFKDLFFSYGTVEVLKNVSFEVTQGEYIGIVGPNGGGKTTALKLMMRFLAPSRGKVKVLGKAPETARTKIGYVPQINAYDKEFPISVLEVVLTGTIGHLHWWGGRLQGDKARAKELLKEVGLSGLEKRPFGALSGGQAQKVLIARALMCDPEILLLDEPTANIDPQSEQAIFDYLKKFQGKKTILIVTHNFDAIVKNVERVLCFQHEVSSMKPQDVCEHFAIGMYHRHE